MEIGGWRGDLAKMALDDFDAIILWHNYDLISFNNLQKCSDKRYKLVSLLSDVWNTELIDSYNALIATHMIEHIKWKEFQKLAEWIPPKIETVLFEAPISDSDENRNWKGDHSSHIFEKGWSQVIDEMNRYGFIAEHKIEDTVIFRR